jgi:alpha-N-arabinofuranosidase
MNRRQFAWSALAGALAPRSASAAEVDIAVLPQERIGLISPRVHGHFLEHLGGVVYDGIWVGEGSKIPNFDGIRKSLADDLKAMNAPVFRWPGGCFADSYNWKDGVGPRVERPVRTSFWADNGLLAKHAGGPAKFDPNAFGTNEFVRFFRLSGGKPYFAANGTGSASMKGKTQPVTCTNPHHARTLEAGPPVEGAKVSGGQAKVLMAASLMAHNTFKTPGAVVPVNLPAASVVALTVQLA